MFNRATLISNLYGVVGFNQPFDPDFDILDAANLISRSNYRVNENPYAKISYLKDTDDYKDISDVDFNTRLKRLQEASITSVANGVFNKPAYIDRNLLYRFALNKGSGITSTLPDGFVGYKIQVDDVKDVAFEIKRVLLDFDVTSQYVNVIELRLYNTAEIEPIQSKSITITTDHQVEILDWQVDNSGTTYKGDYYLGYICTGLTIIPYQREFENASIMSNLTHLNIEQISVAGFGGSAIFDADSYDGLSEATGLNPDITVYKDYTDLITQNELIFAKAINLDFQIAFLSQYETSSRSNRNERMGGQLVARILAEIEGQEVEGALKITGLRPQLLRQISQIQQEIEILQKGYFGDVLMVDTLR